MEPDFLVLVAKYKSGGNYRSTLAQRTNRSKNNPA
jgi:hypothetical protein